MRRDILLILILVSLLIIPVPASASYLEMEAEQSNLDVYLGDEVTFNFTISNNQALRNNLGVSVSGEPQEWISGYPGFLSVPGSWESDFSVQFFPTGETPGEFTYMVSAFSHSLSKASTFQEVTLNVLRPLDIAEFRTSKSGDSCTLSMLMTSKDERNASLEFSLLDKSGTVLREFSRQVTVDGETLIELEEPLPKGILAGDYNVRVSLEGTPVEKECMFTVPPVHKVTEMVKKTSTMLYDEYEVTVVNEGNIKEPVYEASKIVPSNEWITGFVTEPDECVLSGDEKSCTYVLSDLDVGESQSFTYRLDYTPIYATYGLVLVAVFLLLMYGMRKASSPVIIKRHVKKGGPRHHVVLEVRNPFYHNLSNAIVRDWVTPLANVAHNEINAMKPLVKRSEAGTELIWKLGDIRPKETRIITYPLKALVSGNLKMPKAYIRYNKPNGKLRRIFSRPLVLNT